MNSIFHFKRLSKKSIYEVMSCFISVMLFAFHPSFISSQDYPPDSIDALDWSATGYQAIGYGLGKVEVIAPNGQIVKTFDTGGQIYSLAWSPDGTQLAYCCDSENAAPVWNSITDQVLMVRHLGQFSTALNWNPDGTLLATGSINGSGSAMSGYIQLWSMEDLQKPVTVIYTQASGFKVSSLEWNPVNADQLAASSYDGQVGIWDVNTRELIKFLGIGTAEGDLSYGLAWRKDGSQLAVACTDGNVWIWDTSTWDSRKIDTGTPYDVVWSVDGRLAVAADRTVKILSADTQDIVKTYKYEDFLSQVAWSPDGSQIIYGGLDGKLQTASPPLPILP